MRELACRFRAIVAERYAGNLSHAVGHWQAHAAGAALTYDMAYQLRKATGARSYISPDVLVAIAEVEGVGLEWLLGLTNRAKDGRVIPPYAQDAE